MYYRYARMGSCSLCIIACLGLFLSLSCATSFARKSNQPKFTLTKANSGKTIAVHVGDKIAIKLTASPYSRYSWDVKQTSFNILKSLDTKYVQNLAQPNSAEVTGNWMFMFQAIKQGTACVNIKYGISPNGKKTSINHFNITINVANAH